MWKPPQEDTVWDQYPSNSQWAPSSTVPREPGFAFSLIIKIILVVEGSGGMSHVPYT